MLDNSPLFDTSEVYGDEDESNRLSQKRRDQIERTIIENYNYHVEALKDRLQRSLRNELLMLSIIVLQSIYIILF